MRVRVPTEAKVLNITLQQGKTEKFVGLGAAVERQRAWSHLKDSQAGAFDDRLQDRKISSSDNSEILEIELLGKEKKEKVRGFGLAFFLVAHFKAASRMFPLKQKGKTKSLMKTLPSGVLAPKSVAAKPVKVSAKALFPSSSSQSSGAASGASVVGSRPTLDESWRVFCEMTTIDFSTYSTLIQETIEQGKFNKLARLLTAAIRTFIDKRTDQNKFCIEYQLLTVVAVTIKEHYEKIQVGHVVLHYFWSLDS
ncbi:Integrator complex subunit 1 [Parelaphostrongylus tenuis]|uniref:Integrator complex subunit 1 n=1 Tax=Parelaphostrongylus tenuis TaxID=148309 RepID=A0AAD5N215_PARTN|nr:Integrator complex subunit 1 [Parelaphostrongylus tenuis]